MHTRETSKERPPSKTGTAPALDRWWWLLVLAVLVLGYAELLDNPLMVDEVQHFEQAYRFGLFDLTLSPVVTVGPGFHAAVALLATVTGWYGMVAARFFAILFAFGAIAVFHLLTGEIGEGRSSLRTAQFTFLPLVFPFFFLLYSDVFSLLLVLFLFFLTQRKKFVLGGLVGLLACVARQNNILWVAFAAAHSYLEAYGWRWRPISEWLRHYWAYIGTGVLFVVFVVVNGGVGLGDRSAHPSSGLHLSNVWFLLFLSFFLFLPLIWARRTEIAALTKNWWFWIAAVFLFVAFVTTFVIDHPYNLILPNYYLRNRALVFFSSAWTWKVAFFVPVACAAAFFAVVPLRRNWWLLFPATVVFLTPSWLVEQRYYIIPATLFLLARRGEARPVEYVQLAWFALGALAAYLVINSGLLFL